MYIFSWSAEVLFSSKYGSYTNRDKIVWIGLFKTYYAILAWLVANIIILTVFVTLPFYFEITYAISYSVVWWNWISSLFFFKLTTIFSFILVLLNIVKFQIRWFNNRHFYLFLVTIAVLLTHLLYFLFLSTFFGFFTDASEFKNSGWSNLSKIVNGPLKWGWGFESRDHFSTHKTPATFWYKNDPLISSSFLLFNIFLFFFLFFFLLQVMVIIRTLSSSGELSFNNLTFLYSSAKQFYYLLLMMSVLSMLSLVYQFMRFPFELLYFEKVVFLFKTEWEVIIDFINVVLDFLRSIFFFL